MPIPGNVLTIVVISGVPFKPASGPSAFTYVVLFVLYCDILIYQWVNDCDILIYRRVSYLLGLPTVGRMGNVGFAAPIRLALVVRKPGFPPNEAMRWILPSVAV